MDLDLPVLRSKQQFSSCFYFSSDLFLFSFFPPNFSILFYTLGNLAEKEYTFVLENSEYFTEIIPVIYSLLILLHPWTLGKLSPFTLILHKI